MDDLLIFLRALMIADAVLDQLWTDNGQGGGVSVLAPHQRIGAAYPRAILDQRGTGGQQSGDAWAQFWRGTVELELVAQQSSSCPYPRDFTEKAYAQLLNLFLGNPKLGFLPVQGQQVSGTAGVSGWHCDVFSETGHRYLPVSDDAMARLSISFSAMVNRSGL